MTIAAMANSISTLPRIIIITLMTRIHFGLTGLFVLLLTGRLRADDVGFAMTSNYFYNKIVGIVHSRHWKLLSEQLGWLPDWKGNFPDVGKIKLTIAGANLWRWMNGWNSVVDHRKASTADALTEGRAGVVLRNSRTIVCIGDLCIRIGRHGKCVVAGHAALHEDDQCHGKGEGFHATKIRVVRIKCTGHLVLK